MEHLTEAEKMAIEAFYKNTIMSNAVRKMLLVGVYNEGVVERGEELSNKNFVFSIIKPGVTNEQIGERTRACVEAYGFIDRAFEDMRKLNSAEPKQLSTDNGAE